MLLNDAARLCPKEQIPLCYNRGIYVRKPIAFAEYAAARL